jgi:hypothetical protein
VYQAHQHGKWNPRSSAYGRFWIDVRGGERKRRTIALGLCATQWIARLRLREYIERAGVHSKHRFQQIPVPGTTFRQQAEWWMESLSTRRRRPLKPATIYGWQHCLDRWILPNLGNKLVSEVGNGALRQFVEILTAARLAPKTIVNVITVAKFVVASAVDEEGDQIHPRVWNYEFIQLPLVIKEKQNRPTITEWEISALLKNVKEHYAVLVALVAGTGLRIGEALAVRTEDFAPDCRVLHVKASTGVPFTPGFGGDALGVKSTDPSIDVPNLVNGPGCASLINPGDPNHYIKTQCFAVPNPITLRGNLGRNTLIGPGLLNFDFSLFKNNRIKRISDTFNVQFRAEFG